MKITAITAQARNPERVNISVDGVYRFSLDIYQVTDLGIKIGREYSEEEIHRLEGESEFGKLYARALEYCMMRPHSAREVRDYLYRKTRSTHYRSRKTGELKERSGVSKDTAERVFGRLLEKGYVDDDKFARYWVENRSLTKGVSKRKLSAELQQKGVERSVIDRHLEETERTDEDELAKIVTKKRNRYPDEQKFMQYLARQGFSYEDIRRALTAED